MQQLKDPRNARFEFSNLADMVRWLENTPATWRIADSRKVARYDWDLGTSWDQSLEFARDGWPEGVRKLHALAAQVPNDVVVTKTYGVAGEQPDVPRYLAGDPFNMIHRGKSKVPKPTMTIAVNISASGATNAKHFANYGAAMVALIDHLESRRVRVELIGVFAGKPDRSGDLFSMTWHIKHAQDPLDLSAVAFSIGHPAMLRRLGFAMLERTNPVWESTAYGMPLDDVRPGYFINPPEGALLIGGIGTNYTKVTTMEGALAYAKWQINDAYRKLGHKNDVPELEEL